MFLEILPWLIAMAVLIGCSAFFSASEAALFSLRPVDRRTLASGNTGQRAAASLLSDPERVLSAVLFWNLVVNIVYFVIASIVEHHLPLDSRFVWSLRIGALLTIIFCSEMLPKTLAVLTAPQLAAYVSLPLAIMVRVVDPIMPAFSLAMLVSRRLIWPGFEPEESLGAADLERAIELSTSDAKLLQQEQIILRNIVALSDLRADESMRPRNQLQTFCPPVHLDDLSGTMTLSGYLFIVNPESDTIAEYVRLHSLWSLHPEHLEAAAEPVVYVPWCATLADTFGIMQAKDRDVAVVVNENGDGIGVVTTDDVLDVAFTEKSSRSERLLNHAPIEAVEPDLWRATSMTNLRRLAQYFRLELPPTHHITIGGVVQEALQRMPLVQDRCCWGPFEFEVIDMDHDGRMTLHVKRVDDGLGKARTGDAGGGR